MIGNPKPATTNGNGNGNGSLAHDLERMLAESPELRAQIENLLADARAPEYSSTASDGAELNLSENAAHILEQRYQRKDADGNVIETPEELFRRVARAIAQGEKSSDRTKWENRFYDLLTSLKFLPNSPTIVNAGTGRGCLSACFVVSPDDNMESIMDVAHDAAMIEKWGGGIGFGFSKLRPRNDMIKTTHGHACGPIAVMKLYSSVGATLTQGAFRLGAHMGQLRDSHPDIREFITCKDGDDTLQNFNISVQITDAFMQAVKNDAEWPLINPRDEGDGPAGEIVSTIRARDMWNEIAQSAWKTGDPGVVFIDRVWETAPNPHLGQIETSNPCVTGDTLVYTGDGLVPIEDLVGETPTLSLDDRSGAESSFAIKVWQSGVKPVYRLATKEGYALKLTADHEVFTERGKVPAGELRPGDRIRLLNHKGYFGGEGDRNLGLALGWLTGDGHIDSKRAVLSLYGKDQEVGVEMSEAVQAVVAGRGQRPTRTYPTNMRVTEAGRGMIQSTRLRDVVREMGLSEDGWHHVPQIVYRGSEDMQRAYLQALFGADGTVTGDGSQKGVSVRLNSSYPELLEGVQRLLLNFGIASRIYLRRDARVASMPDGKGGRKDYATIPNYEVILGKDNVRRFMDEIGFLTEYKNARLREVVSRYGKRGFYKENFLATFQSLEPLGDEPVYDLTEPMTHSFVANGLAISNCGEEFLEDYGNCCLGSINLDAHVADGAFDWDALEDTIRASVRFLDDVINVNTFPLPKLREVNLATRRIGLGVMGWADALVRMNVPYDSQDGLDLADELGAFINRVAWDESANLARERGPFPEYERSALARRGMPPVRNSSVVTIAPTGTISRLAGCSSGIEPHFALAWWSNVLWKDQESSASRLLDAPASITESLDAALGDEARVRHALERITGNPDDAEEILREHGLDPAVYRTAMGISPEAHIRMQAIWQKHVTNSVSKTINLPNSATVEDVRAAYELAWETGCKAVTVYRDGSKSMQVLETSAESDADAETEAQAVPLVPRDRPSSVLGVTDRVRTGHGNMYVTITFDEDDRPFEVFTALGKAGGCDSANLEAVSRLVSLALRSGIAPDQIIGHLQGITCCPAWDDGNLIRSAPDAMASVLANHLANGHATIDAPAPDGTSRLSRPSAVQPGLFPATPDRSGSGGGFIPAALAVRCPKCSGNLIPQEGCLNCLDCGYSKCE